MMMRPRAISFPTVKTSWILVAIRTLEQFTQVSSTEQRTHGEDIRPSRSTLGKKTDLSWDRKSALTRNQKTVWYSYMAKSAKKSS